MQANLWTESLSSWQQLDYMLFPRIAALSESAWTNPAQKNINSFYERLGNQLPLFAKDGLYYFNPFHPSKFPEYNNPYLRRVEKTDIDKRTKQEQLK